MKKELLLFSAILIFQTLCFGQITEKPLWKAVQLQKTVTQFPNYNLLSESKTSDSSVMVYVKHLTLESEAVERFLKAKPQVFTLNLPYKNQILSIDLIQYDVQTADFEVLDAKTGVKYTAQKGLHYRGVLKNDPLSMAAISVFDNQIMGVFSDAAHGDMTLGKAEKSLSGQDYVFYASQDQADQPPSFNCFTNSESVIIDPRVLTQVGSANAVTGCVRMSLEIDNELYVYNGSSIQNTVNYINGLMNVVYAVFTQEQISMMTSQIFIWTIPDTYVCDTHIKINAFYNTRTNFNGDLAHLITAEPGDGACGGRAWLDVLCGTGARHGVSDINETYAQLPTYSYTVNVISHEVGHNLGSPHTHSCTWVGGPLDNCDPVEDGTCSPGPTAPHTVMSYCPYPTLHNGFGTQPGNLVRSKVQNAVCLSASCASSSCAAPTNFTLSALPNGTSAIFTWTASSGNTTFNLLYRKSAISNNWTTISGVSSPYTLTALTLSTQYEVMVVASCSGTLSTFTTPIIFKSLAGTCLPPSNLTSSVSNTNAALNWTENAAATSWEIRYGLSGFNPLSAGTTVVVNTTKPYTVSSLSLNTSYDWYIRSVCASSATGFTPYGGRNNFTTPLNIVYCTANYNSPCLIGNAGTCGMIPVTIRKFQLNKTSDNSIIINNDNNGCLGATSNHTNIVGNVLANQTYSFSIAFGNSTPQGCYFHGYIGIWIDYNYDGDFLDAGETVFLSPDANTFTGSFTIPSSTTNENKRLRVRRWGGSILSNPACATYNDGEAEDYTLNVTGGAVLPIELLAFNGQNTEGGNLLTWQTASEINTSHFDIERSNDGIKFNKIGELKAQNKAANYQFIDNKTSARLQTSPTLSDPLIDYYRLTINDLDGKTNVSKIVSIDKNSDKSIKITKNTEGSILIETNNQIELISITNTVGQVIKSTKDKQFLINDLNAGIYIISVKTDKGFLSQKIFKN